MLNTVKVRKSRSPPMEVRRASHTICSFKKELTTHLSNVDVEIFSSAIAEGVLQGVDFDVGERTIHGTIGDAVAEGSALGFGVSKGVNFGDLFEEAAGYRTS